MGALELLGEPESETGELPGGWAPVAIIEEGGPPAVGPEGDPSNDEQAAMTTLRILMAQAAAFVFMQETSCAAAQQMQSQGAILRENKARSSAHNNNVPAVPDSGALVRLEVAQVASSTFSPPPAPPLATPPRPLPLRRSGVVAV